MGAGFRPAKHQGVEIRLKGEAVPYVFNPPGITKETRRKMIDLTTDLNRLRSNSANDPNQTFAQSCLLCFEGEAGQAIWDSDSDTRRASLEIGLPIFRQRADQVTAGLRQNFKNRGLLDQTVVIWGGEFGRTPMNEERPGAEKGYTGRVHWNKSSVMFLAGGGIKAGISLGETDEIGFQVTKDPVRVHELNATILHPLKIDHLRLTHPFQGRDFRLTDVHGKVVEALLA